MVLWLLYKKKKYWLMIFGVTVLPLPAHTPEPIYFTKKTYPDAVFLSVLFPVPSAVTEHQEIAGHPVGAPISTLGGHRCDLHPLSKVNLQPLVFVGHKGRPATSSFCKNRKKLGENALKFHRWSGNTGRLYAI